jgi:hypothetical protein
VEPWLGYEKSRNRWRNRHKRKRAYKYWVHAWYVAIKLSILQVTQQRNERGRLEVYTCTYGDSWRVRDGRAHYHIGHGDKRWTA